jgi:hypothetical protein
MTPEPAITCTQCGGPLDVERRGVWYFDREAELIHTRRVLDETLADGPFCTDDCALKWQAMHYTVD